MALAVVLVLAYAITAASLVGREAGGLHWLPLAFVLGIVAAAVNAWVLLVEVLR